MHQRCSGVMVNALDPWSTSFGQVNGQLFFGKTLHSHSASLHLRFYKWMLVNCQGSLIKCWGGGTLQWTDIPSPESSGTPCVIPEETGIGSG